MSKKKNHLPRRIWYGPDKLKAAYLAGEGRSAHEISQLIGGTTPQRVRAMLSDHGITLTRGVGEDILTVRWKEGDRDRLDKAAARFDRPPDEVAALLLRKLLLENPDKIDGMIHELDVI